MNLFAEGNRIGTLADAEKFFPDYRARRLEIEARDESGVLIGRMIPPPPLCPWDPTLTKEQIDRECEEEGDTLAEILKELF